MRPLVTVDEETIREVLPKIIEEGWSSRKVEEYLRNKKQKSSASVLKINMFAEREMNFEKRFGAKKVKITSKTITISFKNNKELETLLKKLEG